VGARGEAGIGPVGVTKKPLWAQAEEREAADAARARSQEATAGRAESSSHDEVESSGHDQELSGFDREAEYRRALLAAKPGTAAHLSAILALEEIEAERREEELGELCEDPALVDAIIGACFAIIAEEVRQNAPVAEAKLDHELSPYFVVSIKRRVSEPAKPPPTFDRDYADRHVPEPAPEPEPEPVLQPIDHEQAQGLPPSARRVLRLPETLDEPAPVAPVEAKPEVVQADDRYWRAAEQSFYRGAGLPLPPEAESQRAPFGSGVAASHHRYRT
jgi:hypothetical protein